jgi:hypothetical protein
MKLFSEKLSRGIVITGIALFFIGVFLFLWQDYSFDGGRRINAEKVAQFGDYVGGLIGSLWALAGVILFYVALTDQREDIKTNREVLTTQVNGLKEQIKEFELQREEMELTRKVFVEQSKTLKTQQFESTFFNSVQLLNNIIGTINFTKSGWVHPMIGDSQDDMIYTGRDSFKHLYNDLMVEYRARKQNILLNPLNENFDPTQNLTAQPKIIEEEIACTSYLSVFEKHQSTLGHYFRTIYNIIKFVHDTPIENPKYYTNLVRAQLSTYEHLLLFYNCLSKYGEEKFKPLVIKYSLLDNMPTDHLLDVSHINFYPKKAYE